MAINQPPAYPNDYSDSDPTQYANHDGGPARAYCEYPLPFDSGLEEVRGSAAATWKWPVPIMLAGLVLATAFLVVFLISTMVKSSDPVGPAPSVVVTHPVTTMNSGNDERQGAVQPTAVAPTGVIRPPATMTNPLEPEPAPATMTNPLEPAAVGSSGLDH